MPKRATGVARPLLLIVDDNADTREMYSIYLSMCGYNVETAQDGHVAVIKARRLYPD
jgi:DNA-binding response OmpR family regulator